MMTRSGRAALAGVLLSCVVSGCGGGGKDAEKYLVGGTITGLTGTGMVLGSPGQPDLAVTAGATSFAFSVPVVTGTAYAVSVKQQPADPAQTCGVTGGIGSVGGADVASVQVTCVNAGPFLIGGTVTGLKGSGLILAASSQPDLPVAAGATSFTFSSPVARGTEYAVTVKQQPVSPDQVCAVAGGAGIVPGADVTDVSVDCCDRVVSGDLNVPRALYFTATAQAWPDGRVLVAGGRTAGVGYPVTDTAELFDSRTGRWTMAASMTVPRASACAASLPTGKVLVAGGAGAVGDTAEVYDPTTDTWTPTSQPMAAAHGYPACVTLGSGKVLITGGSNQAGTGSTAVAEIYDPATGLFTTTAPMATARYWHTATLLEDGRVLVTGGCTGGYPCTTTTATAELYSPDTGSWTATGSLPVGVFGHTATYLYPKVLVVGGCQSGDRCGPEGDHTGSAEAGASLYDPATGAFTPAGEMTTGRVGHVALFERPWLQSMPTVRIVGGTYDGVGASTTELYVLASATWQVGPPTAVDHGSYLGAVQFEVGEDRPIPMCGCSGWLVIGGLGPWTGQYSFTGSVEGEWWSCYC